MPQQVASPSPVPLPGSLVVKNGSNPVTVSDAKLPASAPATTGGQRRGGVSVRIPSIKPAGGRNVTMPPGIANA